ncbi:MAG: glycoside hydrolase family 31 protein [Bacteroidaceae bacterium]
MGKSRKERNALLLASALTLTLGGVPAYASQSATQTDTTEATKAMGQWGIVSCKMLNPTTVELINQKGERVTLDFYGGNIFRMFQDNKGGMQRDPQAKPDAKILVENARRCAGKITISEKDNHYSIKTDKIEVLIDKTTSLWKVINTKSGKVVLEQSKAAQFDTKSTDIEFKTSNDEYFFGGGVQNGRFSHKGKKIAIENTNSWTDGGVCSPAPYYWSTKGYGIMWHTFNKGQYDFGATTKGTVKLFHETNYMDLFVMVDDGAVALLNDYYQLTGNPVLLPKFGFYQGHLNAYNRDYWKETEKGGTPFEDGKRYNESQNNNGGVKESLNGENNNYQFSARAVVDRYKSHNMPLGWVLPNDGYGAGYGHAETLDGNIANLKSFGDYARKNGVEIGLWTQSDLHPKEGISALLQRDIVKEVRDAGVRVLKTDVAWVGAGYSFGLNGVTDVAQIMQYYGNSARPFIISLDGWAGTQRYAGVWSGDQTGGKWEYIRFHIPTYICSGLTGMPNICSDMDGIFGGKNLRVNIRDFQWKTYTPMELNMDGWGSNEKYPHALGEPATSINRMYLKMKAELLPYTYSIAKEAVDGLPMVRAMFLEYPNDYTLGKATQYQFLYGSNLLIAPIYQETDVKENGDDVRNGIYLPEGTTWYDYFNGEEYKGGRILNNYKAPIWKLPVFVKAGAIIPMTNPNNNVKEIKNDLRMYEVYPAGKSQFKEYDDDGRTEAYRHGKGVNTLIEANTEKGKAIITLGAAKGDFEGFVKEKTTELYVNVTAKPKKVTANVGKAKVKLTEVASLKDFEAQENVFFYNATPNLNRFATAGSDFAKTVITKNPQLLIKLGKSDITANATTVTIDGFIFAPKSTLLTKTGSLVAPQATLTDKDTKASDLTPTWKAVENADYYEIEFNGLVYSTITDCHLLFEDLKPETSYSFKIRAVNQTGTSDWASFKATTKSDPLEFAIRGIKAKTSCENQGGQDINRMFDFDETTPWHTKWGNTKAVPFDIVIDLNSINTIERLQYMPREDGGNGVIIKGKISCSLDGESWTEATPFEWANNGTVKTFNFDKKPTVRFLKMAVEQGHGGYGSGQQMYIFKVAGTPSYLPGDINNDRLVDHNDFTSYTNYIGLRQGDSDFEGYVSNGDLNRNGLIDAYDVSVVATKVEGGINEDAKSEAVAGKVILSTAKKTYNAGEEIEVIVKGTGLKGVNALSFALPYNAKDLDYVGVEALGMKKMENLTKDRLHTNETKALYPTFVNLGNQETIDGNATLFVLKFKAKQKVTFNLKAIDGFLVGKDLKTLKF